MWRRASGLVGCWSYPYMCSMYRASSSFEETERTTHNHTHTTACEKTNRQTSKHTHPRTCKHTKQPDIQMTEKPETRRDRQHTDEQANMHTDWQTNNIAKHMVVYTQHLCDHKTTQRKTYLHTSKRNTPTTIQTDM